MTMEQKFSNNNILGQGKQLSKANLQMLREFCEGQGELVAYHKGDQMEREGDPARWFGFVTEGCFKYVTHGISDDKEHITWFSFEGEFVADYPCVLSGQTSQATIEAMMPCRVWRVSGEELLARYQDFHRATPYERYNLLMQRCPGIVKHLNLQDIASFLNVTPKTISKIRKEITFGKE